MATGHVRDGCIFPVGFIVHLTTDVDPAEYFGGKWQRIKGRFLLAADDTYPAGSTGGEAEHTLIVDEMPNHHHTLSLRRTGLEAGGYGLNASSSFQNRVIVDGANPTDKISGDAGGGQAHNNMPPYQSVYIWERIG